MAAAALLGASRLSAQPAIFFIQDVAPTSAERDFQGFGKAVVAMPPGASITLFGSDRSEYFHGSIEKDSYQSRQQRQRMGLIGQARQVYTKIREQPGEMRDYASVLAEVIPRMKADALLILQGMPFYKRGPIDFSERIPSISWVFSPASPFGPGAIPPAPVRFRATVLFDPEDFASPNHRMEIQRFWAILFERLNGSLCFFTTDREAIPALLAGIAGEQRVDLRNLTPEEKNAPLKLEGVSQLIAR